MNNYEDVNTVQDAEASARKNRKKLWIGVGAAVVCLALVITAVGLLRKPKEETLPEEPAVSMQEETPKEEELPTISKVDQPVEEEPEPEQPVEAPVKLDLFPNESAARLRLLDFPETDPSEIVTPSVAPYKAEPGLTNVSNCSPYMSETMKEQLERDLFLVYDSNWAEFFELYENNRYAYTPNFITIDSLMHTYHLYFSLLLNRTEKNYLAEELQTLSRDLQEASIAQYESLVGTQWEEAAGRNVAFFTVAAVLQDPDTRIPAAVKEQVTRELEQIYAADSVVQSEVAEAMMDYSQFKPRGYYEGDEVMEQYFRAMMWYGQVNFSQKDDSLCRSSLLMTMAMAKTGFESWEKIYTVTSFFAGASDDLSYYEYAPAIAEAYGGYPTPEVLVSQEDAYARYVELIAQMQPPAINSVPVFASEEGDLGEMNKGFRFMGQRFTVDAAILQQLIYRSVEGTNSSNEYRMLPDALDVPAALGSDTALQILQAQGETEYAGYSENMAELRTMLAETREEAWTTSLYSSWLYTLMPLLEEEGEGYPSFMTGAEWNKKSLETFAGSYTELKHDTVLYAKQAMAEMGGGPPEVLDDRGYVEPVPEVYRRFMLLAQQTADGLENYGLLSTEDLENLSRLEELARRLLVISNKELQNQTLSDEEYELIRCYGGTLEHFWIEAVEDKNQSTYLDPKETPSSLVTDIATDPNGSVLQIATGRPAEIIVVVPVDGQLRLAYGAVYDFYQFEQPLSQRLTDATWRQMLGQWAKPDGTYNWKSEVERPWWTASYRWIPDYMRNQGDE